MNLPATSLLLLGPTGSGKTPLGDLISARGLLGRRAHHLDFGAELRSIAGGGSVRGSFTRREKEFIYGVLERGLLLENEHFVLAEKILRLFFVRCGLSAGHVLVLNGIPRHAGQAGDIARVADIRAVVSLECSAEDVYCRVEDNIGGDRTGRDDDARHQIEKKLTLFRERTAPLIDHYERSGRMIYRLRIRSSSTPESTYRELSALAASHPPFALVAEPPQG